LSPSIEDTPPEAFCAQRAVGVCRDAALAVARDGWQGERRTVDRSGFGVADGGGATVATTAFWRVSGPPHESVAFVIAGAVHQTRRGIYVRWATQEITPAWGDVAR
jgi:hypothetical protein